MMTRPQLAGLHFSLCEKARELQEAKNKDYAHEKDIFRNFRYFGTLGVLVRLSDKLARLRSFEENGVFAVQDEKLVDTILDTINYAVIYYAMKQEAAKGAPVPDPGPVQVGPFCCWCEKLATHRLDLNNEDTEFYCDKCAEKHLTAEEFASLTAMEKF